MVTSRFDVDIRGSGWVFGVKFRPGGLVALTGVGPALVFWLVNSVLLGRELIELVWLRHAPAPRAPLPVGGLERAVLGGAITALLAVPFVNLLAPVLGAAAAAHLVHRKGNVPDAA